MDIPGGQWYVEPLGITQACKTIHGTCIPVSPTHLNVLTQSNVLTVLHWLVTTCALPSHNTLLSVQPWYTTHICTLIAQLTTATCGHINYFLLG